LAAVTVLVAGYWLGAVRLSSAQRQCAACFSATLWGIENFALT